MNFPATPSDVFNFPSNFKGDVQIFHANNQSTINYQQWIKPRGTSMTYFFLVGGGGGGGGGHQKPSTTNGGGGGGGGSGSITKLIIPSFLLPNSLYIRVGVGGLGGNVSTAGGAATTSHVLFSPLAYAAQNSLISSESTPAGGGGAGLVGAAGAAGTAADGAAGSVHSTLGIYSGVVGQAGGAGGAITGNNGTSITAWSIRPISSGAGGASPSVGALPADFQGGSIASVSDFNFPKMNFTTVNSVAAGGGVFNPNLNGDAGINFIDGPFLQSGGAGGGSAALSTAGNGGKGGIGCGGGGGGAGTTGGRGGNGGNGMVAIFSW
jgi:hypothetical protein